MSAHILVVDDIEANRRLLQAKLEAKYFTISLASDGHEAIEKTKQDQPDIILLDVMMPGIDGFETCKRLKADPETAHIPVVMVTALSEVEHRVRGLEAGAEDFLSKPVDDFALMSRIRTLSRYNAVAQELRQREASGVRAGLLDDVDQGELDAPSRVLVIDDNPRSSARLAAPLRAAGHTVVTLQDEGGGLGNAMEGGADLAILSMGCSEFDALRLCAQFKMTHHTRSLTVVVAYQDGEMEQALQAMELGASDMIQVPIDDQELLARVRTQTRRGRYIDILRQRVDRGMELAIVDQLTGLYNRRYLMTQLDQRLQRAALGGETLSVMVADIDHFKQVNDTYGHDAGDKVLQELARRLKSNVRPSDVVCRQGGEEFVVIMPDTPGDIACTAAERIRRAVAADLFEVDGVPVALEVTLSGGVSAYRPNNDTPAAMLKRADEALYKAKEAGRNRVESVAA
ncbi:MAG: PleD family two-component system response regulator [Pseudomonadota bacterium]